MSWFLLDRNLKLLEPYDWKLSRTVLRGERGSNAPDLPGMKEFQFRTGHPFRQFMKLIVRIQNINSLPSTYP